MRPLVAALLLLGPALALAGERTLVLKTYEDPRTPPDRAVCDAAGFDAPVNVFLGATVWSLQTRGATGEVANEAVRQVGTVTGCAAMTSLGTYAPKQQFLMHFLLEDGVYHASGECDLVSIGFPVPRLMLVGCALQVVQAPEGVLGGIATSASVLSLTPIAGFGTGSVWTLHLYTEDREDGED